MKVEIIKQYFDTTMNKKLVSVGTILEVSTERGEQLIEAKVAKEIKTKTKKK